MRERWVREHFRALAQSIVDRGVLWYGTPEAIKDMVTQSGAERINELTAQGRAVILLAPHFIGLDAAATRLTMEVPSAATMYTPQSDPHIDAVVAAGQMCIRDSALAQGLAPGVGDQAGGDVDAAAGRERHHQGDGPLGKGVGRGGRRHPTGSGGGKRAQAAQ